ncbi:metal ABC transporter ATP-binding protein [Cellulomonas sp. URHD0024]|uniref:metal ABC transporter ATP-binding protein n=1 Tax=Cellulomonas sp. URHD0024 TaxID=1302620 RepID=UPI00040DD6A3|nr:metal ABC transporter ATP-binding protein [Cellulomonas sp. URHD0024]
MSEAVPVIEATALGVTIGGQPILTGIHLTVTPGEVLALLGANGSGKSTLVRSLLGVIPTTAGSVRLFGVPLGPSAPWSRIGYVPQRMPAASGVPATALEVVASGFLHGRTLRRPHGHRQSALSALRDVGLAERAHQAVQEMSGGQQQRVLIARALVRRPDLLVLDEPTSGIDIPTQSTFVETVSRLHDAGTTVVVILHELGPFAPLIDRAVVLRHGRVAHDGPAPRARGEHAGEWHDHTHAHSDPEEPPSPFTVEVLP